MRREVEEFDDGKQTIRVFDEDDRLFLVESLDTAGALTVTIEYLYDDAGTNVERIVRDSQSNELRRLYFDASGEEIIPDNKEPVRWASMDGTDEGVALKGQEKIGE